jgi:hypothetical protein
MCQLQGMTRTQLEAMTKDAIIQAALSGITVETITNREYNSDGELTNLETTITDAYSGVVIETKKITKTFHPNKAVDKIKIDRRDGDNKKIEKYHIKHDAEGKEKPYRVDENGGEMKSMSIVGYPLVEYVITEDTSQAPVVNILGAKVPLMSDKLWKLLGN